MSQLSIYWFPGDSGATAEVLNQFIPEGDDADEMTVNIEGTVLRFGSFVGLGSGVVVEVNGETAFIVFERRVDPAPRACFDFVDEDDHCEMEFIEPGSIELEGYAPPEGNA